MCEKSDYLRITMECISSYDLACRECIDRAWPLRLLWERAGEDRRPERLALGLLALGLLAFGLS